MEKIRQVRLRYCTCVTFFGRYLYERSLRTLHYMDLPSAAKRLKANFSGVIAFDFSIDVVANTVFGSHKTKKTYWDLVLCSNGNK